MLQEIILVVTKISEKESQYIANHLIEICCIHDQNKLFTERGGSWVKTGLPALFQLSNSVGNNLFLIH